MTTPKDIPHITTDQHTNGKKLDDGKTPLWSIVEYFPRALECVAWVNEYGARKYTWGGWRTVTDGIKRYFAAELRHAWKVFTEGQYDEGDSGLSHKAQKAWNALADLELSIAAGEVEIRRGNDIGADGKPILNTWRTVS